jgi:hypothetical protein
MLVKVTSMGPKLQSQNRIDVNYKKTFSLGAYLIKLLWKSNISLTLSQKEKSLAPKLTNWWPFKLQNIQMGVAGSIFEPNLSNFGNQPIFLSL